MTHSAATGPTSHQEDQPATPYWALAICYLVAGLIAYARIVNTFFVADDFAYLDVISRAHSPAVVFMPLAERYFRPAVVLVYYLNFQLSGLVPWTYHLSVVLIHIANAWLVFLLGRVVAPSWGMLAPALAGFLFLVFGGHAEAVTWIGGMADPLLTLCLLTALWLFSRGLEAPRPMPWLAGSWIAFAAALMAKESAAVFLGLAGAFAVLAKPGLPQWEWRRMRRAGLALIPVLLLLGGYFATRRVILGFTFVDLNGLGTSTNLSATARAFTLRSFFPQSDILARIWNSHLDLYVLAPAFCVLSWFVRREDYRPLALAALGFGLTVAPVLPLSIALADPESERFIYLPSAFACMLLVFFLRSAIRSRWVVTIVVLLCAAGHLMALDRVNRSWVAAATATRGITTSFGRLMQQYGEPGRPVFVMNVPDSVNGAYVYRRGFPESLRLVAPDQARKMTRVYALTTYTILDPSVGPSVMRRGQARFDLSVGGGQIIGDAPSATPSYTVEGWSSRGFSADFAGVGSALIVYFTPTDARLAGELSGVSLPFGFVDLPADGSTCSGREITFLGWALDRDAIARVTVGVSAASSAAAPASPVWVAQRVVRPDVAAVYPGYRDSALAGWRLGVPCATLAPLATQGGVRLVVTAENRGGQSYVIGERRILAAR